MPKKNKFSLPAIAATLALSAFLYYNRREEEEYNNFYNSPLNSARNWGPIYLANFLSFLTVTTSLILATDPERSNFRQSKFQKTLNKITALSPGIIAALEEGGSKVAKLILGSRGQAMAEGVRDGTVIALQLMRIGVILERMHENNFARAIENPESKQYEIRYIETIAQRADEAVTSAVELTSTYLWYAANYGLLPSNFPCVREENKLHMLALLYLLTDGVENFATSLINNFALAIEIIVDNRHISSVLTKLGMANNHKYIVYEPKIIVKIREEVEEILKNLEKIKEQVEKAIEDRIEEANKAIKEEFSYIKKLADEECLKVKEALKEADNQVKKFESNMIDNAHKLEEKIAKIVDLEKFIKKLQEFEHYANEKITKLENYIKYPLDFLEEKAQKIQALWRGHAARKVDPLSEDKESINGDEDNNEKEKATEEKTSDMKTDNAEGLMDIAIFGKNNIFNLSDVQVIEFYFSLDENKKELDNKSHQQYLDAKEEAEKIDYIKVYNESLVNFEEYPKNAEYIYKNYDGEIIEPVLLGSISGNQGFCI